MIASAIVIFALASQSFLAAQAGPIAAVAGLNVTNVCEGHHDSMLTASQVTELAEQIKGGAQCSETTKENLIDLAQLLAEINHDVCSAESISKVRGFMQKHVADKERMPKAVEKFALSYFLRISEKCKAQMAKFLATEASDLLKPEDFEALEVHTREGGPIDMLLDSAAESNNILLPADVAVIFKHAGHTGKLALDAQLNEEVHQIKEVCAKRFKPIYEAVVKPVMALAMAGFDFSDFRVRQELDLSEEQIKRLDEFNRIVFLCETMDLVVDAEASKPAEQLEQIHFEAPIKVSLDEVAELEDEYIGATLAKLRHHQTDLEHFRRALVNRMLQVVHVHEGMTDEQAALARQAITCLSDTDKLVNAIEDAGLKVPSKPAEKKMCGAPSSFGSAFKMIFIGAIVAGILMVAGGGD